MRRSARRSCRRRPALHVVSSDPRHWHLLAFDRYELRRAGGDAWLVRDPEDRLLPGRPLRGAGPLPPATPPRPATSRCGLGSPRLLGMREGISVGYGDDPAPRGPVPAAHRPPAGRYVLVHRANPGRRLRERSYGNAPRRSCSSCAGAAPRPRSGCSRGAPGPRAATPPSRLGRQALARPPQTKPARGVGGARMRPRPHRARGPRPRTGRRASPPPPGSAARSCRARRSCGGDDRRVLPVAR